MSLVVPDVGHMDLAGPLPAAEYHPRRPQDTVLHRVVREHFQTFLAHTNRVYSRPLPRYVVQEWSASLRAADSRKEELVLHRFAACGGRTAGGAEKYLVCGDLVRGHVKVVCGRCGLARVVPFSCKTRGLCSSCAGRRMAGPVGGRSRGAGRPQGTGTFLPGVGDAPRRRPSAARLVDSVLPDAPLRQWVLSLPFDLRLVAAARADALRHIVRIFVQTIFRGMRRRLRMPGAAAGAVAATHRAGGALNLNVHLHVLVCDGVFVRHPAGGVGFHRAPAPSPNDLAELVQTVRKRVLRRLARMGLLRDERRAGEGSNEAPELSALEACETLALRAGDFEAHEGTKAEPDDVPGRRCSRWSAQDSGFNVHAGLRVPAGNHVGREQLARYITRPAFAMDRFSELADGRIAYQVRHPLGPDRTHRVMTPLELIARLAAIVPPPRYPLLRYFGVLAAHSPWRSSIIPRPPEHAAGCHHAPTTPASTPVPSPPATDVPVPSPDPLFAVPQPVPRTLSPEHWRQLDDGRLLARQPRLDWATLLRRTLGLITNCT